MFQNLKAMDVKAAQRAKQAGQTGEGRTRQACCCDDGTVACQIRLPLTGTNKSEMVFTTHAVTPRPASTES